jgi:hypothetical protein
VISNEVLAQRLGLSATVFPAQAMGSWGKKGRGLGQVSFCSMGKRRLDAVVEPMVILAGGEGGIVM